ncbi:MAG: amidohydrolase family protein [Pirellulales bacterium]|nr:amidohydrolase family protein [Pirellulales bacterium]
MEDLQPFLAGGTVFIDAPSYLYALRADQVATEFGLNLAIVSKSGEEYRRLNAMRELDRLFIVSVNFPDAPDVSTPERAAGVTVQRMMHWDIAPENPGRMAQAGIPIALSSHGLRDTGKFLDNVRMAVARGLDTDQALAALTTTPAEAFGLSDRLGKVAVGMSANLVVTDGDLFDANTDVLETWVDGTRYEVKTSPAVKADGEWEIAFNTPGGETQSLKLIVTEESGRTSGELERGETSVSLKKFRLSESVLTATFAGEDFGYDGVVLMSATLDIAVDEGEKPSMVGAFIWADGQRSQLTAERIAAAETVPTSLEPEEPRPAEHHGEQSLSAEDEDEIKKNRSAMYPVNYPLGAYGREEQPEAPAAVLFTNATVWTSGPEGVLSDASVLVENGIITAVGKDLTAPQGCVVIDCTDKHISPGIIDCHSHSATDGGVNESSQSITAEVRIGDFVNADDVNIYRQLAGGVTAINVLHGSANTIGGQNQVLKMRWGALPEAMKFTEVPAGIKFALGENVTRKRSSESTRYPRSRMGVEQLVRDAFTAGQAYRQRWKEWKQDKSGTPPVWTWSWKPWPKLSLANG